MHKETVHAFIQRTSPNGERPDGSRVKRSWRSSLGTISGATLLAFFTRLLCPSCWPMYAGILSSMGLGFLMQKVWLMPLTIITLLFVIASLAYRANSRRGLNPFILGILGAVVLLSGQFILPDISTEKDLFDWILISKWSIDTGAILLITASVWNGWPRKRNDADVDECPSCSAKTERA